MARRRYEINSISCKYRGTNDESFKLCICSMVVFIVICCTILLISWIVQPFSRDNSRLREDATSKDEEKSAIFKEFYESREQETSSEKINKTKHHENKNVLESTTKIPYLKYKESKTTYAGEIETSDPIGSTGLKEDGKIIETFFPQNTEPGLEETNSEIPITEKPLQRSTKYLEEKIESFIPATSTTKDLHAVSSDIPAPTSEVFNGSTEKISQTSRTSSKHEEKFSDIHCDCTKLTQEFCETADCKFIASRMLSIMDHTANPCENFYQFSCGKMTSNCGSAVQAADNKILDSISNVKWDRPESHKKLKAFYEHCLNFYRDVDLDNRIIEARNFLDTLGEIKWDQHTPPKQTLTSLIIKSLQHGSSLLFDIDLDVISNNGTVFEVVLTAPKMNSFLSPFKFIRGECEKRLINFEATNINLNTYYEKFLLCQKNYTDYINSVEEAIVALGYLSDLSRSVGTWFIQNISVTIDETIFPALQKFPSLGIQTISYLTKDMREVTLQDLQKSFPQIDWKELLEALFKLDLEDNKVVHLYFEKGFKEMFDTIGRASPRGVQTALMAILAEAVYRELVIENTTHRKKLCLTISKNVVPDIVTSVYLDSFHREELELIENKVFNVTNEVFSTFEEEVNKTDWLSEEIKVEFLNILQTVSVPPPEAVNEHFMMTMLEENPISDNFFLDVISLLRRQQIMKFTLYEKDPTDLDALWFQFIQPYANEEKFIHGINVLLIPLTISSILLDDEIPEEKRLSVVRQTISRGIAHVFDLTGFLEIKHKKLISDPNILDNLQANVLENGIHLYNKTHTAKNGKKSYQLDMNPYLSINRRIADITGTNLQLLILHKLNERYLPLEWGGFTALQSHFITMMQEYCEKVPFENFAMQMFEEEIQHPYLRVQNIVENSPVFSEIFNCPQGAKMNPEIKFIPFPWSNKMESPLE